jgi:hypothetical protein
MLAFENLTTAFRRGAMVAACAAALVCSTSAAFAQQDQQAPPPPQTSQDQQAQAPDPNTQQQPPPADQQQDQQQMQQQAQAPQDPNAQQGPTNDGYQQNQQDQQGQQPPPDQSGPQQNAPADNQAAAPPPPPPADNPGTYSNGAPRYNPPPRPYNNNQYSAFAPDPLTIPAGTNVQIRTTDWLSSDKNHKGDQFIGTLAAPIIVNGWVVARRGQSVTGTVTDAQRAGRVKGVSKLQLDLSQLTLVDGQLLNVQTTLLNASAGTSNGRDAAGVAVTTGTGAAIGAAAGGGVGAGIGAGAGLVAGVAGVLLTRGKPTIIPPEDVLTFRTEQPLTFTTAHGPYAFRQATAADYGTPRPVTLRPVFRPYPYGYYPPPPPPGYYPYGYYAAPPVVYYGGYYRRGWGWGW